MSFILGEGKYFGDPVRTLQNDLFQCNISKYDPGQIIQEHYHENNYLSLLISGKYAEKNNSGDQLLESGNIIFRPSLYNHSNNFQKSGGYCLNIELKQNHGHELDFDFKLPSKTTIYQTGSISSVYKLFHYFIHHASEELCLEQALICFLDLNRQIPVSCSLPWVEKVRNILDHELEIHHTIQSVSERVFVHPVYLAGAFKKKTGYTIGEYQLTAKLKKSIYFLFNTEMSVREISDLTGFYDTAHFVRSFKMVYQISPKRFRSSLKA